jgi:hypothetical protein
MGYVFVSYSRRDTKLAERLERLINDARIDTWRDNQVPNGSGFTPYLIQAIESASCLVLVCTKSAKLSPWAAGEVEKAEWSRRRPLFALMYDRTNYLPTIRAAQHFDMRRRWDLPPALVSQLTAICGTVDQQSPRDLTGRNLALNPRDRSTDYSIHAPYSRALVRDWRRRLKKQRRGIPFKSSRRKKYLAAAEATRSDDFGKCMNFARCRNYAEEQKITEIINGSVWPWRRLAKLRCDECTRNRRPDRRAIRLGRNAYESFARNAESAREMFDKHVKS